MQLIDGYNGGIPHIDAQMIRDHHLSLYGTGDYVLDIGNKFNYEIVNNNEIKIYDGYAMMQGARVSIGYGQSVMVTIENGTSGYNRNDIICIKYTRDEETLIEKIAPEVVKGTMSSSTAADPTIVTGNIRSGAVVHQMPLYRVRLSGTNISGVDKLFDDTEQKLTDLWKKIYPVGAIYISTTDTNPSTFMGGTWARFGEGRTLVGVDASDADFSTSQKTGGAKTHKLTEDEMPSHYHSMNSAPEGQAYTSGTRRNTLTGGTVGSTTRDTGGNQPHNNMQPYITVYMWRRTA